MRNAGIRSRGTGSRSGEKPGLRLDFDRYTLEPEVSRAEVADPPQQHAGSVEHARAAQHAAVQAARTGRAARRSTRGCSSTTPTPACTRSSNRSTRRFVGKTFGNDAGYLYKYDYNVTDAGYYFTYRTVESRRLRAAAVQAGNARNRSAARGVRALRVDDQQRLRRGVSHGDCRVHGSARN